MHSRATRGFTLIELLVVIAIIGILASITLVAIGNARNSGGDAGVKGNLNAIRTQVELYLSNNSTINYDVTAGTHTTGLNDGNGCGATGMWADPTIKQAVANAAAQAGTATLKAAANRTTLCKSTPTTWLIAVVLKSDTTQTWCVDSAGRAKLSAVSAMSGPGGISGNVCP